MKLTKKGILSIALSMFAICFCAVAIFTNTSETAHAISLVFDEGNLLQSKYFENQAIVLPDAKISVDGVNYVANERVLHCPDGKAYSSAEHKLSQVGDYTVEYFAEVNGKVVSDSVGFEVVKDAHGVIGGATVSVADKLTKKKDDADGGLSLTLPEGGKFVYNQSINISSSDTTKPIIELYPYNRNSLYEDRYVRDENGEYVLDENGNKKIERVLIEEPIAEARIVTVRITDCYDENNYVEVFIDWNLTNPGDAVYGTRREATCTAAASGQKKTALLANPSGNTSKWYANKTVDGQPYLLTMGSSYGKGCSYDETTGISIYYEYATNRVYFKGKQQYLLTDLDDSNLYFTTPIVLEGGSYVTGEPFKGFSTGEVYISVYATEYYHSAAHVEVSSIYGVRGQSLAEREVFDSVKPTISVDVNDGKTVYAAKGEEFKIFSAAAKDLNGIKSFNKRVYYDYGTQRQSLIGVVNGAFVPTRVGVYTIEYVAEDYFGNVAIKTVEVLSVNSESGKSLDFNLLTEKSYKAGEKYEIPFKVDSLNGKTSVTAVAAFNESSEKKTLAVDMTDDNNGYLEFEPSSVGEYTFTVVCKDGVIEKSYEFTISVVPSEKAYLASPILPDYLIAGMEYTFDYNEIIYFDGKTPSQKPTVYAVVDSGEKTLIDYEDFLVPQLAKNIKFLYYGGDALLCESKEIDVVDVKENGNLAIEKYFTGDFTARAVSGFIEFTSNKINGDNELKFVNPVSLANFNFTFSTGVGNFNAFDITLTNYYDRAESCTYSVYANGSITEMALLNANGEQVNRITVNKAFYDSTFFLQYNEKSGMTESIAKDYVGIADISSDKVLVTFTMRGIGGKATVKFRQLNNQTLNDAESDIYGATYTVYGIQGKAEKGGEITLLPVSVSDVLSPYLKKNFKMTVVNPDGSFATATNGTLLDNKCDPTKSYTIKLGYYGTYTIRYVYTDASGESVPKIITIEVSDTLAPTLKLADGYSEKTIIKTTAGKKIKLVGYEASDDTTSRENLIVSIVVINPRNEVVVVGGDELELNLRGEYRVYYYCYDECGNYSTVYYTIIAK